MKALKLLAAILLTGVLIFLPTVTEGRGGGGHGRGSHSGGSSGWSHGGGHGGQGGHSGGVYQGGHRGGYYGYHHGGGHFGRGIYFRSWGWDYPYFSDFGFLPGYWNGGYYYSYPSNYYGGVCLRFIPTGGHHAEIQQDPETGQRYVVQVPNGYWETVPCP